VELFLAHLGGLWGHHWVPEPNIGICAEEECTNSHHSAEKHLLNEIFLLPAVLKSCSRRPFFSVRHTDIHGRCHVRCPVKPMSMHDEGLGEKLHAPSNSLIVQTCLNYWVLRDEIVLVVSQSVSSRMPQATISTTFHLGTTSSTTRSTAHTMFATSVGRKNETRVWSLRACAVSARFAL
jgi:hypothetical protein